jgi:hypothetical protein
VNGARILAWILFVAYCAWLFALEGWLGAGSRSWMPDLGLVLALSVLARAEVADAPFVALAAAFARTAFGPEPPMVVLTGSLVVAFLALAARQSIELTRPLWRTLAALLLVLVFDAWLGLAQAIRSGGDEPLRAAVLVSAWPVAVTSALLAFLLGPAFANLPGLSPIRRRRW